jgi:putative peptide zinc metalloprotease protein
MTAAAAAELADGATLAVRALSVVPEGDEFVVGDAESSVYVVLPAIGVRVLELLASGRTLEEVSAEAHRVVGRDIDVVDFAQSLLDLGFATLAGGETAVEAGRAREAAPLWLRHCFSRIAWAGYAACALAAIAFFAIRPSLFPRASDIFFLGTPVRSLAALTAITYVLAAAHEGCHWLAARAEGVPARISVSRRLYFLAFEIDLTGLWSLPRRRRYSALLAGMAFDAVLLFPLLFARFGDGAGWWRLGGGAARVVAALAFVEVTAITAQFWIFVRTDVYAVLITATGCVNLFRVNQLMVRRALRITTPTQEQELVESHERDVAVARWFRWIYVLGLAAAAWFFVVYFAPATIRLVTWIVGSIAHSGVGSEHFWEALVFGGLIFSPQALTLGVALRDLRRWRARS